MERSDVVNIVAALERIQDSQARLTSEVEALNQRVTKISDNTVFNPAAPADSTIDRAAKQSGVPDTPSTAHVSQDGSDYLPMQSPVVSASPNQRASFASRIILTQVHPLATIPVFANSPHRTYPRQIGIKPLPMTWGHVDPHERGPVVVSRSSSTIRRRNG